MYPLYQVQSSLFFLWHTQPPPLTSTNWIAPLPCHGTPYTYVSTNSLRRITSSFLEGEYRCHGSQHFPIITWVHLRVDRREWAPISLMPSQLSWNGKGGELGVSAGISGLVIVHQSHGRFEPSCIFITVPGSSTISHSLESPNGHVMNHRSGMFGTCWRTHCWLVCIVRETQSWHVNLIDFPETIFRTEYSSGWEGLYF